VGGDDVVMDLLVMHTEITVLQIVGNQVMVLFVVPYLLKEGGSTMRIMHFELLAFLFQYIPKLLHFVLLGWRLQRVTGYIFGTAFWGFVLNLAAYFCAAHVREKPFPLFILTLLQLRQQFSCYALAVSS
jgi:hypothetical protein